MMKQIFIDAVETGNLISVRYSLTNELLLEPSGKSYQEMKAWAEEKFADLYEPLEGELKEKPLETYTEEDLLEMKNELDANFSRERLALYEQVVPVVLREKIELMAKESKKACGKKTKCCSEEWSVPAMAGVVSGVAAGGMAKIVGAATGVAVGVAVTAGAAAVAAAKFIKKLDGEDEEL